MGRFAQSINNSSKTFNGAETFVSSLNPVVDLFFLFGASRGKDITPAFEAAWNFDHELTTRVALWGRDIRGGAGERQQFRNFLSFLVKKAETVDNKFFNAFMANLIGSGKISELGRWDDYLVFMDTPFEPAAIMMIGSGLSDPNTIGLVAKWMPRQGRIAHKLANAFGLSPRNWRKRLVASTNVVEQLMCAKRWSEIEFQKVPSVASARYQKAFTKRAPTEYGAYKNSLVKGEAKINASAVYPYDVFKSLEHGDADVAQAQWNALPNYLADGNGILPIVDVSGSMTYYTIPGMSLNAMEVAISLGLYVADKQQGDFHNVVMNFSDASEIIKLHGNSLLERMARIRGMAWGGSTNLENAFKNLLDFANRHNLKNVDMPKIILVLSDMEFNPVRDRMTNYQRIEQMYKESGYTKPNVVFWNLNGRIGNSPVTFDKTGTAMVSGFSPSIMRSIISGNTFTPFDIMMETIGVDRYSIGE